MPTPTPIPILAPLERPDDELGTADADCPADVPVGPEVVEAKDVATLAGELEVAETTSTVVGTEAVTWIEVVVGV